MNKGKLLISLSIISFLLLTTGLTLSYWRWASVVDEDTNVILTVGEGFSCKADAGGDINTDNMQFAPSECGNSRYAIKRKITYSANTSINSPIDLSLWLDIKSIGPGLKNTNNFKYAVTTTGDTCDNNVLFAGRVVNNTPIIDKTFTKTGDGEAYLWIWLDKDEESTETMDQIFNASVKGKCEISKPEPSAPVLNNGMIPVKISDNGTVKTISSSDESWYNYRNKQWANAILVTEDSRSSYLNTSGTTVQEDDILAYYVWIPRYKYQIWTNSESTNGLEQEIDIIFESKYDDKSMATNIGDYYTHPAFTFGNTELDGFWVGKFESSGDAITPKIKPNLTSLRSQNISTQFKTSLKFSGGTLEPLNGEVSYVGNQVYGLTSQTNSHMMKNSEWGAVTYLSHSQYGVNYETRLNNNLNYTTGCGASNDNSKPSEKCDIAYGFSDLIGINKYPQSTTGNITGIFDMSGGAWEYVMGNLNETSAISGFTIYPTKKYYDNYMATSSLTACNGEICYGHALSETTNWYGALAGFDAADTPWFKRGGNYNFGSSVGIFSIDNDSGNLSSDTSWRSVLTIN